MFKKCFFCFVVTPVFLVASVAFSQTPPTAVSSSGTFEVIDISGQISGEPMLQQSEARDSWNQACQEWKKETKDLNKNNEILGINCNNATCNTVDVAKTQCTSTGTYKVKTAGTKVNSSSVAPAVPEPPQAAPLPPNHEIATAPPTTVVEIVPPHRAGFVWIPGYWGWEGRHHVWIPGHWVGERPGYVWVRERWDRHGQGWHFEPGHWEGR